MIRFIIHAENRIRIQCRMLSDARLQVLKVKDCKSIADQLLLRISATEGSGIVRTVRLLSSNPLNAGKLLQKKHSFSKTELKWFQNWLQDILLSPDIDNVYASVPHNEEFEEKAYSMLKDSLFNATKFEHSFLFQSGEGNVGSAREHMLVDRLVDSFRGKVPIEVIVAVTNLVNDFALERNKADKLRKSLKDACGMHTLIMEPILTFLGVKIDSYTTNRIFKGVDSLRSLHDSILCEITEFVRVAHLNKEQLLQAELPKTASLNETNKAVEGSGNVGSSSKSLRGRGFGSRHCLKLELKCTYFGEENNSLVSDRLTSTLNTQESGIEQQLPALPPNAGSSTEPVLTDPALVAGGYDRDTFGIAHQVLTLRRAQLLASTPFGSSAQAPQRKLFLLNLPPAITALSLQAMLERFGRVSHVQLIGSFDDTVDSSVQSSSDSTDEESSEEADEEDECLPAQWADEVVEINSDSRGVNQNLHEMLVQSAEDLSHEDAIKTETAADKTEVQTLIRRPANTSGKTSAQSGRNPLATFSSLTETDQSTPTPTTSNTVKSAKISKQLKSDCAAFITLEDVQTISKLNREDVRSLGLSLQGYAVQILDAERVRSLIVEVHENWNTKKITSLLKSIFGNMVSFRPLDQAAEDSKPVFIHLSFDSHQGACAAYQQLQHAIQSEKCPLSVNWFKTSWYYQVAQKAKQMEFNAQRMINLTSQLNMKPVPTDGTTSRESPTSS